MNDKLKQSLQGRLSGMRWGEREQAEVFRQIHRKELQDVKHLKRGTGMLAVAIAMLFIMMGAAFGLTQHHQPEDVRIAGQTVEPTFVPVPAAQYENEYFTLTIGSTAFTGKHASFIATIRLKDPDSHMLMLAGHTPPGDPNRTPLTITPSAQFTVRLANGVPLSCGSLTDGLDVLSMTSSAATFRMAGDMQYAKSVTAITLWLSYTEPASGAGLCAEITIPLARTEPAVAPAAEPLLENEFITVRMTESRIEGTQASIGLDVTPSKSWYALNRTAEDKATLTIHLEPMLVYSCSNREELLTLVDYRSPTLGEMAFTVETTPEGLHCSAQGELPAGWYDSLLGYVVVSIYSEAALAHDDTSDVHYAEVIVPLLIPQVAVTPSPVPQPVATPTPAPKAAVPKGALWVFENDLVTGYLTETAIMGAYLRVVLDIVPKDPQYVINTYVPGKSTLQITADWFANYDNALPLVQADVSNPQIVSTTEGARVSAQLPFSLKYDSISISIPVTTLDTQTGQSYTNTVNTGVSRQSAPPEATPTPLPAADSRPASAGKFIGGTEHASVYQEDSWYDGFCAEITLRIRADDAAARLAITPNAGEHPSENTWVVQLEGSWNNYYRSVITPTLTLEEATGDVIVHLTYIDLRATLSSRFTLPVTLTVINEQTWLKETKDLSLQPVISGNYPRLPLRLLSSTSDNTFVQAGYITTDRYHYIGVMRTYDNYYASAILSDMQGNQIGASVGSVAAPAESLILSPRALFPFSGGDETQYSLSVIRLDASVELPEIMQVRFDSPHAQALPSYVLTTQPE